MDDTISLVELDSRIAFWVGWAAWLFPFAFYGRRQKRASITAVGPTVAGVALQTLAFILAFLLPRGAAGGLGLAAAAITGAVSIALVWSATRHLGKQLRVTAGLYEDHELVRSGPYAIVRHPIYAGLLGMLLFSMLLLATPMEWAAGLLALCVVGTEIRVRAEDGLLESRFSDEFRDYRRRVRAYIPFVR